MDDTSNPPSDDNQQQAQPPADQGGQPTPPPAGQPAGGQPQGAQPAGGQPPADQGAQPAGGQPAGDQKNLSGIMEENVDISSLVSNAGNQQQIQDFIASVKIPAHPNTKFEEKKFVELLATSISLTQNEKKKIIEAIPQLSQFQIDELMKIFVEEQQKFTELEKKHAEQMVELEKQHKSPEAEKAKEEEAAVKADEEKEAEDLKKSLGL